MISALHKDLVLLGMLHFFLFSSFFLISFILFWKDIPLFFKNHTWNPIPVSHSEVSFDRRQILLCLWCTGACQPCWCTCHVLYIFHWSAWVIDQSERLVCLWRHSLNLPIFWVQSNVANHKFKERYCKHTVGWRACAFSNIATQNFTTLTFFRVPLLRVESFRALGSDASSSSRHNEYSS